MRVFLLNCFLIFQFSFLLGQSTLFISPGSYNLESYKTIEQIYAPPHGFNRLKVNKNSFAAYLRDLPVLKDSINVLDFKNRIWIKSSDSTLAGVVPIDISGKRLWQCMDILIRMHADYLDKSDYINMNYPLPDGTMLSWQEWQKGIRPVFKGTRFNKILNSKYDSSPRSFSRYLNTIFEYSGTQSFWHYYPDIDLKDIIPGDFIVKKGKKGHAVLIVDIAVNEVGDKVALIGQGDTPACQFYLLKQTDGNLWFNIDLTKSHPDLPIKKEMYWSGLRRFPN